MLKKEINSKCEGLVKVLKSDFDKAERLVKMFVKEKGNFFAVKFDKDIMVVEDEDIKNIPQELCVVSNDGEYAVGHIVGVRYDAGKGAYYVYYTGDGDTHINVCDMNDINYMAYMNILEMIKDGKTVKL